LKQGPENASYRWVILGTVFSLQTILSMTVFSFGPLAPFLLEALNINRAQLGLFNSLINLAVMIFGLPAGWLIDRFGVRRLLLVTGMLGVFFALFSRVDNVGTGYVLIFLAGIGYAFTGPSTSMALVHWFSPRSRATALSIKQSAVTIGSAVGAVIIPVLATGLGWSNTTLILGAAIMVVVVAGFLVFRDPSSRSPAPQSPALAIFRRLLGDKRLLHLGLACGAYGALQISISTYLVLQLVQVKGMPAIEAGAFLMVTNIGGAVGRIMWGSLSDRAFGGKRKTPLTIIGIISGTLAIVLSIGISGLPWGLLFFMMVILGATAFGWNGVFMAFATEISSRDMTAAGLGWAMSLGMIGAIAGPPLFGYIVDRTTSYNPAWLIFGIVVLVAALSLILIKEHKTSL